MFIFTSIIDLELTEEFSDINNVMYRFSSTDRLYRNFTSTVTIYFTSFCDVFWCEIEFSMVCMFFDLHIVAEMVALADWIKCKHLQLFQKSLPSSGANVRLGNRLFSADFYCYFPSKWYCWQSKQQFGKVVCWIQLSVLYFATQHKTSSAVT